MFHKTANHQCVLSQPQCKVIVPVEKIVSEVIDGVSVDRAVIVPVDIASKQAELSLPKASEYTLENLIKAGVDLKTLNPMDFFRSNDPFDVDRANDAEAVKLFKELQDAEKTASQDTDVKS